MELNIKNNNQESNAPQVKSEEVKSEKSQVLNQTIAEPIEDAVIVSEEVAPKVKSEKRKVKNEKPTTKSQEPKAKKPTAQSQQYSVITYTTKKGGTACYLAGFKTEADAKALADQLPHSIGNSYRYNDKGEKVYVISFGTRYVDAAKALCHALNNGDQKDIHKYIADCHEIYNAVVSSAKAEREKKTQERKAERAKAKADELAKVKKANGLYSMDDIAAMMKRVMAGEEVPELKAVKEAMGLAA